MKEFLLPVKKRMFLFVSSIVFIYCTIASCAPNAGRSASALNDICRRFPWLNPCHEQQQPVDSNLRKTPPPNEDVCSKYKSNYDSYCNANPTDYVIKEFCDMYKAHCGTAGNNVKANTPAPEHHLPLPPQVLDMHDITEYCLKYKNNYAHHCVNRQIHHNGLQFCYGYNKACPGSPDPGTAYLPIANGVASGQNFNFNDEYVKRVREQIERVANSAPVEVQPEKPKDTIDWSLYSAP